MLDQLLQIDEQVFIFLNALGSEPWDNLWLLITNKLTWIPFYAVLLFFVFKNFGLKNTLIVMLLVALMIAFTDQFANLFKHSFERPRPCREAHLSDVIRYIAPRCGRFGYFSAHAASSMALAVFLGLLLKNSYKNLVFILLFWAAIVAYSRIYVGVHYPLDIITGMFIGALTGFGFYKIARKCKVHL